MSENFSPDSNELVSLIFGTTKDAYINQLSQL